MCVCCQDLEVIFSSILGVLECTINLLSSIEDQVEATGENEVPLIGTCFMEMIEVSDLFTLSAAGSQRIF